MKKTLKAKAVFAFTFLFLCLFVQSCRKDRGKPNFLEDTSVTNYFSSAKQKSKYFLEGGRTYELDWTKVQRVENDKKSYLIFKVNENVELVFTEVNGALKGYYNKRQTLLAAAKDKLDFVFSTDLDDDKTYVATYYQRKRVAFLPLDWVVNSMRNKNLKEPSIAGSNFSGKIALGGLKDKVVMATVWDHLKCWLQFSVYRENGPQGSGCYWLDVGGIWETIKDLLSNLNADGDGSALPTPPQIGVMLDWGSSITAGLPDWGPPNNQGTYDPVNTPNGPGNVDTGLSQYPANQWDPPTVSGYSNQLITDLGLTGERADFIIFYPNIAQALVQWRVQNNYPSYALEFQNWSIDYLMSQQPMSFSQFSQDFLTPNDMSGVENIPSNVAEEAEIQNGFTITFPPDSPPTGGRVIGRTLPRNNTEDLTHGINANLTAIRSFPAGTTDNTLFNEMTSLMDLFTNGDFQLRTVGHEFVTHFRNNTGTMHSNAVLNDKVKNSVSFKNFIKTFTSNFNTALQNANGNINNVSQLNLTNGPIFNSFFDKVNGLTVLINDTEKTDIILENFSVVNGKWTASLYIVIIDHFGLDRHDVLAYQWAHSGFAAWWLLQHDRDYKPFETKIAFKVDITEP